MKVYTVIFFNPRYEKTGFLHICENKDADQLRGNRGADQRLCFRYSDSTIPLLPKSEISSLYPSTVVLQPGLCRTWSEIMKTGFLTTRLKCFCMFYKLHSLRLHPAFDSVEGHESLDTLDTKLDTKFLLTLGTLAGIFIPLYYVDDSS